MSCGRSSTPCTTACPQNRPRLWVVGLRSDTPRAAGFVMPGPLPVQSHLTLADIIDQPAEAHPDRRPRSNVASCIVSHAAMLAERDQLQEWTISQGLSLRWGMRARPRPYFPCLLHANTVGYWIGSQGRHATLGEHARAQGLPYAAAKWPKPGVGFSLLGNSMSRAILQRLIHAIFVRWGVFCGPDPWESGVVQHRLKLDAGHGLGDPPPGGPRLAPGATRTWAVLLQILESTDHCTGMAASPQSPAPVTPGSVVARNLR